MANVEATQPTRRSGTELQEAIREAIREELAERGYTGLTFEGVARRAQTSKPGIYRRYATRAEMVLDAWMKFAPVIPVTPSTGSLRTDLIAISKEFFQRIEHIGVDTIRGVLAEASEDLLSIAGDMTWDLAKQNLEGVLQSAQERGEIPYEHVPPQIVVLPIKLMRHELLFSGGGDQQTMIEMIDTVCLPLLTGIPAVGNSVTG